MVAAVSINYCLLLNLKVTDKEFLINIFIIINLNYCQLITLLLFIKWGDHKGYEAK